MRLNLKRDLSKRGRELNEKSKSFFKNIAADAKELAKTGSLHHAFGRSTSTDSRESGIDFMFEDDSSCLVESLPPKPDRLRTGLVEKCNHEGVWQRRQMCLTQENLLFAREDSDDVIDKVMLISFSTVGLASSKSFRYKSAQQKSANPIKNPCAVMLIF